MSVMFDRCRKFCIASRNLGSGETDAKASKVNFFGAELELVRVEDNACVPSHGQEGQGLPPVGVNVLNLENCVVNVSVGQTL